MQKGLICGRAHAMDSATGLQAEPSEELVLANMRAEEMTERLAFSMVRSMFFADNPKMAAAMRRLERTMARMR